MRFESNVVAVATILSLSMLAACGSGTGHHDGGGGTDSGGTDGGGVDTGMPGTDMGGTPDMALPEGCGDMREPCCRGTLCGVGLTCVTGTCEMPAGCGSSGQPCCSGTACASGLVCMGGSCATAPSCGSSMEPCCASDACGAGLVCDRGTCGSTTACGGSRQPCCSGTACATGLVCTGGSCDTAPACGDVRQPCCGGTACNSGLTCTGGTCDSPTAPPDTCGTASACGACTAMAACGFCKSSSTCQEGTSLGPTTGSCSDWAWYSSACTMPDPCAGAGSCDSCTAMGACGYCRTTGACQTGTSIGPTGGSCSDWAWVSSMCAGPANPCSVGSPGCNTCTGMASCGYCRTTGDCQTGTSTGPTSGSCGDWAWYTSACVTADPCLPHLTCGECGGASGCGWCEDDDTCHSGNSSGPSSGSCSTGNWDYVSSACPSDPCLSHSSTCDDCAATPGCGYCEEDGRCRGGASGGPTDGVCNDWRYLPSACPSTDTCDSHGTCTDCAGAAGCGWCSDGVSCRSGDSTMPAGGACDGWTYLTSGC